MNTRNRYLAEFEYPGMLFPESITRVAKGPSIEDALAVAPTETEGTYFVKDGWYAVRVKTIVEKRYVADDGAETWLREGQPGVESWIVGDLVHVDAIQGDENDILRSNIRSNSRDPHRGFAVHTRAGNWQIRSDWDHLVMVVPS